MEYTPNSGIQAIKDWLEASTINLSEYDDYARGYKAGIIESRTAVGDIVYNIGESLSDRFIDDLRDDVDNLTEQRNAILADLVQVESALHIAHEHFPQDEVIKAKIKQGVKLDESDLDYIAQNLM